ncbi:MAG: AAA family ATPase [Robiginitomaculum sp.]
MTQPKQNQVSATTAYPSVAPSVMPALPRSAGTVAHPVLQQVTNKVQQQPSPYFAPPPVGGSIPAPAQVSTPNAVPRSPLAPNPGGSMPPTAYQPGNRATTMVQQPSPAMPVQTMPVQTMPQAMPLQAPMPMDTKEGGEKALPGISIHSFCERPETARVVQSINDDWRMARTNLKVYMGGLPAAIEHYNNENTPGLVMFESGLRGPELFAQLARLAAVCDSGTKVVMIGAVNDIKLYRELMDQGISDYIVPPFHPLTLIRALSDLYADPDKPFVGKIISFFGAKGGVGSSTIAHNIAWALAGKIGQETALVDLDSSWGTTALDFMYDCSEGLEEALSDPERLDATLLDRIMVRHSEKLTILPAAATLGTTPTTLPEAYEALVAGVRSLSPLAILDIPHIWTDWSSQILKSSDEIVITATPDLANLRNTKNLVDYLKTARPNDVEPLLILNKMGVPKVAEIPEKDFVAAVGLKPAVVIGYDPAVFTKASNDGKMLSDVSGAQAAFEGIMYLAHRLRTGDFPSMVTTKKKGKGLGKFVQSKDKSSKKIRGNNQSISLFAKLKKRK